MNGQSGRRIALAHRVREIRRELYGASGERILAEDLGLPVRTWRNYEAGVSIPATVILRLIEITGANAGWLLTGRGDRFGTAPATWAEPSSVPPRWAVGR